MQATGGKQYGFLPLSGNINASTATADGSGCHVTLRLGNRLSRPQAVPTVDHLDDHRLETDVGVIVLQAGETIGSRIELA